MIQYIFGDGSYMAIVMGTMNCEEKNVTFEDL